MQISDQERVQITEEWELTVSQAYGRGIIDGFLVACALAVLWRVFQWVS